MIDYEKLWAPLARALPADGCGAIEQATAAQWHAARHGDLPRWQAAVENLPAVESAQLGIDRGAVSLSSPQPLSPAETERLRSGLLALHPWRKGPFNLFGVEVDSEWRCQLKWARIERAIDPLVGRRVLDVGCGNGYYSWRLALAGAELVVGIDPGLLFTLQYWAVARYLPRRTAWVLPLALEALPEGEANFDIVLSMGVLYHRRSPVEHLERLRQLLRPGGQLLLETLVVEGDRQTLLLPPGRYAKMRNVWFIPSVAALGNLLGRCGFRDVELVDVSLTDHNEQRRTDWMRFESLADFLDPADTTLTIEGHPRPRRALLVARR
ncbi:MAG TPA: tRNA 5-methoxyuridine(34)/uridine 5-oxyacetic acid(34) synthase CmoB [Pseudomonadales bacterium]|nr:tRNA 5-methoxyuridine(34)/uridine 5-oxyacetic acid(34) synthase CmoB [Pseudomonadales bacterium]HMW15494.1 tRNA 5-methoxyuridine(34)/uridine 5-oxyacetic acid(34) synthase CmoB [Pseudomonadales bacterium]HMW83710.1 tRNA 5-methoxyuridine(34)/uridine 5-oxyacetic acid(34) synthase CmoB [Pseudomonadales bacterium]HMY97531.1 tRNA 5-methoxyuridine(34)/uridine 5-oxyacetic acid(34) synthase CmoB [Pseudomonadales bacterium]HMZ71282.1 tRNA 5-methoxyuridine(34)/uridine 5-oxyacetic acid(34) synthase CmoB